MITAKWKSPPSSKLNSKQAYTSGHRKLAMCKIMSPKEILKSMYKDFVENKILYSERYRPKPQIFLLQSNRNKAQTTNAAHICNFEFSRNQEKLILILPLTQHTQNIIISTYNQEKNERIKFCTIQNPVGNKIECTFYNCNTSQLSHKSVIQQRRDWWPPCCVHRSWWTWAGTSSKVPFFPCLRK